MNIVIYSDYALPFGGAGKVAFDSAIAFAGKGHNVTFFSGTGPESELLKNSLVSTICLNQPDMLSDKNKIRAAIRNIWNQKAYKKTLRLLQSYDKSNTIIMVHGYAKTLSSSIFAAFKKSNFKIMVFLHDYFAACPNGGFFNYQKHQNCILRPLSKGCLMCNCDVRSYSQKLYRFIRLLQIKHNLKGNGKNLYAYNVSELSGLLMEPYVKDYFATYKTLFNPVDINKGEYIDITKNKKYLYIGRLSEEKGIRDFCKVISDNDLEGIVLGDGYLMDEMKRNFPKIEFRGWVSGTDKMKYINQAKCLVFPSKVHETFGLAVAEMLSYGIPCIVPDGCGCTPLIQNGKNGFIYPMGDANSLEECVNKFESIDLGQMMEATRKSFIREDYSVENYITKLENEIKLILK